MLRLVDPQSTASRASTNFPGHSLFIPKSAFPLQRWHRFNQIFQLTERKLTGI